jgi:SAM-dependent methyltransferase
MRRPFEEPLAKMLGGMMSLQILKSKSEITDARGEMIRQGISALEGSLSTSIKKFVSKSRLVRPLIVGDFLKSWDVLKTVDFIQSHVSRNDPVLDIGAYASEVLVSLHKSGYRNLTGIDFNTAIRKMPASDDIKYVAGDFLNSNLPSQSYAAVTAISVIEHGYDADKLFGEVSRLLRKDGVFIASFDYWPEKIDTSHIRMFDLSWTIFSKADLDQMIADAAKHGLVPVGDVDALAAERAIEHAGQRYTFGWIALRKAS